MTLNVGRKRQVIKLFAERSLSLPLYWVLVRRTKRHRPTSPADALRRRKDDDIASFAEYQHGTVPRECSIDRALVLMQEVLRSELGDLGLSEQETTELKSTIQAAIWDERSSNPVLQDRLKSQSGALAQLVAACCDFYFPEMLHDLQGIFLRPENKGLSRRAGTLCRPC